MTGGSSHAMFGMVPDAYNLVVNANHPLINAMAEEVDEAKRSSVLSQAADLALLSKGLLKGEALTRFVRRSVEFIK
jgi:molecular chaperone HtpG